MKYRFFFNLFVTLLVVVLTTEFRGNTLLPAVVDLENAAYDARARYFALKDAAQKNEDVVIVDIDKNSLAEVGEWPWGHDVVGQLVGRMAKDYGAAVVGVAIPFPEEDDRARQMLMRLRDSFADDFAVQQRLDNLAENFEGDRIFVEAVRGQPVVFSHTFDATGRLLGALPPPLNVGDVDKQAPLSPSVSNYFPAGRGYTGNLDALLEAANNGAGHLSRSLSKDGAVRALPALVVSGERLYPSFFLSVLRRLEGVEKVRLYVRTAGGAANQVLNGKLNFPVDYSGSLFLRFMGKGGRSANFNTSPDSVFRYVPAADILSGEADSDILRGKIALLGSSAGVGPVGSVVTPVNAEMPGVELQALALANIRDGTALQRDGLAWLRETAALLVIGALLSVAFVFLGPLISFVATAALGAAAIWYNLWRWEEFNEVVYIVPQMSLLLLLFFGSAIFGFVSEWRANLHLQDTFGQYVPPEVAKALGQREVMKMGGESRELTVLFSDVRDFTSISEQLTPAELTTLMNQMLTGLSRAIHQQSGTVDKYIGDAVMAFWNAPLTDEKHAERAVLAALEMQQSIESISREREAGGLPPLLMGVGINTGEARVGNMGSEFRMAYTAMGDTVNLASRLEGLTKKYGVKIIVGQGTRKKTSNDFIYRSLDAVRVKGKEEAVLISEVVGHRTNAPKGANELVQGFEKVFRAYRAGDFGEAREQLAKFRERFPGDAVGAMYEQRLAQLGETAPEGWDGVVVFEDK